jgi:hypothetical protein
MKLNIRRFVHTASVVAICAGVSAWPDPALAQDGDLSGIYRCEGVGASNERYEAIVEIAKHDKAYMLRWISPGGVSAVGVGLIQGDALAVTFYTGRAVGVVIYRIQEGSELVGQWTQLDGNGEAYEERLTKSDVILLQPPARESTPRPERRAAPKAGRFSAD